jgi:2-aminoethylphosphonate-pyruvate transaminase
VYLHLPTNHAGQERGEPLFTPAVHVAYAFDEALAELLDEGVEARIARYRAAARLLRAGFERLGLGLLLPPERRSNTITALGLPAGTTYAALHDALKARGFVIYAGQGALASRIFRVANMGDVSLDEYRAFLDALAGLLPDGAA